MRRASVAVAAAALATLALGSALAGPGAGGCEEPAAAAVDYPSCTDLWKLIRNVMPAHEHCVSREGRPVTVSLYWGSEPARAASALLHALLRHVLRYRRVRTLPAPGTARDLATNLTFRATADYNDLAITISTAWEPGPALSWSPGEGRAASLAGPRLYEFGSSPVPARCRLHARLAPNITRADCRQLSACSFYANATLRAMCGFLDVPVQPGNVPAVEAMVLRECSVAKKRLRARGFALLRVRSVSRAELLAALAANHSVLFADYDIWTDEPDVRIMEPPPCESYDTTFCQQELDSTVAMRIGDVSILQSYAPRLFKLVHDFNVTAKSLRQILQQEADGVSVDDAACRWIRKHITHFKEIEHYLPFIYDVKICVCIDDPDRETYLNISTEIGRYLLNKSQVRRMGFAVNLIKVDINCSNANNMSKWLADRTNYVDIYKLLGVVSPCVSCAAAASSTAAAHHVPVVLVDVAPEERDGEAATWRGAGRPAHVVSALRRFVRAAGWTRVGVLSQDSALAVDYDAALRDSAEFLLRQYTVPHHLTETTVEESLRKLQKANVRIIFVNADAAAAVLILTAAFERRMSYADGFVWIVRDWRPNNATSHLTHIMISLWSREKEDVLAFRNHSRFRNHVIKHLGPRLWPPLTASYINALLALLNGFTGVFQRDQAARHDLRTAKVIRLLDESLSDTPVAGIDQVLHYKKRALEEAIVYVDEWHGDTFKRLARWLVNVSSGHVSGKYVAPDGLPTDDGRSHCVLRGDDPFDPTCYDQAAAGVLLLLVLVLGAMLLARRALRRRLERLELEHKIQMIARRRHVAAALAPYLVERHALRLDHEIGAGRFGSVRTALLRVPSQAPRHVAAKALRDNASPAEESEFLREACTIASLDHAHVVRLVGICITDGPPLVLMELALFGDLLGYLRARRHLAESGTEAGEEAAYVSAEALTRLAVQAAGALQYLETRSVVHRDVRAANCLLDARRSLKLADFGMARYTEAERGGAPEYACRRRALFPVLWMAPESLAHGVFSPASDVWALGVLLLELVTLGARPYGAMSPLRVLEYVAAGGQPPLPLDASADTCWLAGQCWQRTAERRPRAGEVATWLAARPRALAPALLAERDTPDADSGFGESPSAELLPPDSPVYSRDQLATDCSN